MYDCEALVWCSNETKEDDALIGSSSSFASFCNITYVDRSLEDLGGLRASPRCPQDDA